MDQDLETILDEAYLDGLADASIERVRAARSLCRSVETQLSYLRRLIQGRHDLLAAEIARRADGGSPDDIASLVDRLPGILADRGRPQGSGHIPEEPRPEQLSGSLVDRLDAISDSVSVGDLVAVDVATLQSAIDALTALEADVSSRRRAIFDRIDAVETVLLDRYREGGADVDELLAGAGADRSGE